MTLTQHECDEIREQGKRVQEELRRKAEQYREDEKELRHLRRLAYRMVEIGCREFTGPIEMMERLPQARALLRRIIKGWVAL